MTADNRSAAQIEKEIASEREALGRDLDELQRRLTVDNLVDDVKLQVKAQIDEVQRQVRSQLLDITGTVGTEVRDQISRTSGQVARLTRENPLPMLVTGAGLAWLAFSALRQPPKPRPAYAPIKRDRRSLRGREDYDYSPADMAAAELEEQADDWARTHVEANSNPIPPYDARPSWAREDEDLTLTRPGAAERI